MGGEQRARILALDTSTNVGWAFHSGGEDAVRYGTKVLTGERAVIKMDAFEQWLSDMFTRLRPEFLVVEKSIFRGSSSPFLYGLTGIAGLVAHRREAGFLEVAPSTVKKFITGYGLAKKKDVISAIQQKGFPTRTDHEADALAILLWAKKHEVVYE